MLDLNNKVCIKTALYLIYHLSGLLSWHHLTLSKRRIPKAMIGIMLKYWKFNKGKFKYWKFNKSKFKFWKLNKGKFKYWKFNGGKSKYWKFNEGKPFFRSAMFLQISSPQQSNQHSSIM